MKSMQTLDITYRLNHAEGTRTLVPKRNKIGFPNPLPVRRQLETRWPCSRDLVLSILATGF